METQKPSRRRRYHPEEFKQAVIEACCEQGASVAGIAMSNGVNANQVRQWMRERGIEPAACANASHRRRIGDSAGRIGIAQQHPD